MKEEKKERIRLLGEELLSAWQNRKLTEPFTKENGDLTLEDAYGIQKVMLEGLCRAGFTPSGRKLGYTNPAMQRKMGLESPSWGVLLKERRFESGAEMPADMFLQPGIETELLFAVGEDLNHGPYTTESLREAVPEVYAAMEIVDMRQIRQGKTQRDSVGDLGAFGGYVRAAKNIRAAFPDYAGLTAELWKNGEKAAEGSGAAVMGDPWNSLLWLANLLWNTPDYIRKGEEIMTGSFTPLIAAAKGDEFRAVFGGTESLSLKFL